VRHASIVVDPSQGGSRVTVSVTDVQGAALYPFDDQFVPGLAPYDGRLALAARTGGANANHDVDNIRLNQSVIGAGERLVLAEDFESPLVTPRIPPPATLRGTPFAVSQFGSYPGSVIAPGPANQLFGGFLRLTTQTGNQNNTIAFDQTAGRSRQIDAEFDVRISDPGCCSGQADGLSFLLIPTEVYDNTGPLPVPVGEEPNLAGAFGVGFDTFDNDEEDCPTNCTDRRANHVSLHWDGAQVGQVAVINPVTLDLANGQFNRVNLRITEQGNGSSVTVSITDGVSGNILTPIVDRFIPGMDLENVRAAFASRTGAAADHHDIDNVRIVFDEDATPRLGAGDADQDLSFDQFDLLAVQVAGKYLSALGATWGQGDWNGAPGGRPGSPPPGDDTFNQRDLQAALGAGIYRTGPYATGRPSAPTDDDLGSVVYNAASGEVRIDLPLGLPLTSISIESDAGVLTGDRANNLGGSFDFHNDRHLFKATFGSHFGSLSFGNVAAVGLDEATIRGDLSAVGTVLGASGLTQFDVIHIPVPEPPSRLLLTIAGLVILLPRYGQRFAPLLRSLDITKFVLSAVKNVRIAVNC
jgi:hypothetical protein